MTFNRRTFILATAAAATLPLASFADKQDYTDGLVEELLADGKTVFLDFTASWCSTCAAQERVINALREENADYDENIAFVDVDWDEFGNGFLSQSLNIPRRSTLVVLKGEDELGRIVAGTSKKDIKALMDTALSAATS